MDYREALTNFRAQLTGVVDLDTVLATLYDQIAKSVDAEPVWVFLRDARTTDYVAHATPSGERPVPGTARFLEDSPLAAMLAESRGPLYIMTVVHCRARWSPNALDWTRWARHCSSR